MKVVNMTAEAYINQEIAITAGGDPDNYFVRIKPINQGRSTFVTVVCRYAPWQHNDHPLSPYNATLGRHWNRTKAVDTYNKHKPDREALKWWFEENGSDNYENWPGYAGAKLRCGNKKGESDDWRPQPGNTIADLKCPDRNTISKTVEWKEEMQQGDCYGDGDDRDLSKNGRVTAWTKSSTPNAHVWCKNWCKGLKFLFAGLQNGNECHCGNKYGKYQNMTQYKKPAICNKPCQDNGTDGKGSGLICGGEYAQNIYPSGYVAP